MSRDIFENVLIDVNAAQTCAAYKRIDISSYHAIEQV